MNVAEVLVGVAVELGCDTAFSLTGGMAMHLNKAAHDHRALEVVYCHHETSCVASAEGYAMTRDFQTPGLAVVTSGPGVSNALTGMLSANGDSCPVLVLAGQIKSADIDRFGTRTHGMQEIDSASIVAPAVKAFIRASLDLLNQQVELIVRALTSGRKGAVFVEVPLDVQMLEVPDGEGLLAAIPEVRARVRTEVDAEASGSRAKVDEMVAALSCAERPAVVIGNGARAAGAEVDALVARLDEASIPRFYTWMSQDIEAADSPLNMGSPGGLASLHTNGLLQQADVVVTIGCRLDLGTTAFQPARFGARGIRYVVDVDEAELRKLEGSENTVLVHADARTVAATLVRDLRSDDRTREWAQRCISAKVEALAEESTRLDRDYLTVREVALAFGAAADHAVIATSSSGAAIEIFIRFLRTSHGTRCFHGGALGSMGLGLAHGIGAGRSAPHRVVWIVESDGGLWMSVQELATLSESSLGNVTLFVLNNGGYASIALSQRRLLGYEAGAGPHSGVRIPSFDGVASAVGLEFVCVTTGEQLVSVLQQRSQHGQTPMLVEIQVPATEDRGPQLRTVMGPEGPRTPDLADLSW